MNYYLEDIVKDYKCISIIGMCKNSGKTEVLNHLLKSSAYKDLSLGITSIGRDGEGLDIVTGTKKPRIFIREAALLATARGSLPLCDFTKEILYTTGISTPMGEIVIVRARSCGYVDLSGPSTTHDLSILRELLYSLGCDRVIIDGALGRKSLASPAVADGCILATGAALNPKLANIVSETTHRVRLFSLKVLESLEIIRIIEENIKDNSALIIQEDHSFREISALSSLHAAEALGAELDTESRYLFISGAVIDKHLRTLISQRSIIKNLTLVVWDSTKLLVSREELYKGEYLGLKLRVLKSSKLLALTVNPTSPYGFHQKSQELIKALEKELSLPILDVLNCPKGGI